MSIRRSLPPLLAAAVSLASLLSGCARSRGPQPLVPASPPAIGSQWVAPASRPAEAPASRPAVLLRADDVDGSLNDRVGAGRAAVPYLSTDAWMGAELPTVTLVAFVDYECPYSKRLAETLYELVERYPDDLRVVLRHRPLEFHQHARLAAEAAVVAQRHGRFWPMHDALFAGQADLGRDALARYAGLVGLSIPEVEAELDAHSGADAIARDLDLATELGVTGTPTSFVNGRKVSGAMPFPEIAAMVDEEIALAEELMHAGARRHELYARVMRAATDAGPPAVAAPSGVAPGRPDPALAYAVPAADRPIRGPKDALVTVVVFSDFQCPFCMRVTSTLDALRAAHPKDVRLVYRHHPLPFHQQARDAARAAIAAGNQGKFWEMHDLLFAHQRELDTATFRRFARKLKLNVKTFERDMKAEATEQIIAVDEMLAERFGANGTPAFFVNGRFLGGAQPLEAFSALVAEELPKARARRDELDSGDLYENLIAGFVTSVDPPPAP